jgi:hypothetical protein
MSLSDDHRWNREFSHLVALATAIYRSTATMSSGKKTTDHNKIRKWVEERNGHPAIVKETEHDNGGVLRVDFQEPDEGLEQISWEKFFEIFDSRNLAFLYQDATADGKKSRFNKLVERD